MPNVIFIASSTGGPQALTDFIKEVPKKFPVPIIAVQHMPKGFTQMLAHHLDGLGGVSVREAVDGDVPKGGLMLLAPGDYHMVLNAQGHIRLNTDPPENFCRPAADPTLRSLISVYGDRILSIVLTGMGQDGLLGCEAVVRAKGTVWAQDEKSSVVWGMPGAVARAGIVQQMGSPTELGKALTHLIYGGRP